MKSAAIALAMHLINHGPHLPSQPKIDPDRPACVVQNPSTPTVLIDIENASEKNVLSDKPLATDIYEPHQIVISKLIPKCIQSLFANDSIDAAPSKPDDYWVLPNDVKQLTKELSSMPQSTLDEMTNRLYALQGSLPRKKKVAINISLGFAKAFFLEELKKSLQLKQPDNGNFLYPGLRAYFKADDPTFEENVYRFIDKTVDAAMSTPTYKISELRYRGIIKSLKNQGVFTFISACNFDDDVRDLEKRLNHKVTNDWQKNFYGTPETYVIGASMGSDFNSHDLADYTTPNDVAFIAPGSVKSNPALHGGSLSSPRAASVWLQVQAANPVISGNDAIDIMKQTSWRSKDKIINSQSGFGFIDDARAIEEAYRFKKSNPFIATARQVDPLTSAAQIGKWK